jgi:hypothetical protein
MSALAAKRPSSRSPHDPKADIAEKNDKQFLLFRAAKCARLRGVSGRLCGASRYGPSRPGVRAWHAASCWLACAGEGCSLPCAMHQARRRYANEVAISGGTAIPLSVVLRAHTYDRSDSCAGPGRTSTLMLSVFSNPTARTASSSNEKNSWHGDTAKKAAFPGGRRGCLRGVLPAARREAALDCPGEERHRGGVVAVDRRGLAAIEAAVDRSSVGVAPGVLACGLGFQPLEASKDVLVGDLVERPLRPESPRQKASMRGREGSRPS